MESLKDPRRPRKNPELKFVEKAMLDSWRRFRSAEDYAEKRGNAMILQAHLEEWLAQPHTLCDLQAGVSSKTDVPYRLKGIPKSAELVFDKSGNAGNLFFFSAGGGSISQLFTKAELEADPDKIREYGYYVVVVYEKIYATRNSTQMHFTSEEAIKRHVNSVNLGRWVQKNDYDVLIDPQGCPNPQKSQIVSRYRSKKTAVAKADQLAKAFGIRFAVARVHGWADNH